MEVEKPNPSQPLLNEDETQSRKNRIADIIKDTILSQFAESNPSLRGSKASSIFLKQRLQKVYNAFDSPTHLPYTPMILRAITELNEEGGSTQRAISYFIRKEFEDLPWSHEMILASQLRKLCAKKELVCNESGRYVLMVDSDRKVIGERKGGREKMERGEKINHHNVDGDRKVIGECKGSREKMERGKKRNNHNVDGDRKVTGECKGSREKMERGKKRNHHNVDGDRKVIGECKGREKMERGKKRNHHNVDGDRKVIEECKGSREKMGRGKKRNHHNVDGGEVRKKKIAKTDVVVGGVRKRNLAETDVVVEKGKRKLEGGIKEQVLLNDFDSDRSGERITVLVSTQENGEEELNQSIERVEDQANSKERLTEVVGKQSQSKLQGTSVVEQHTEAEAAEAPAEESQCQDSILQSETICSSNPAELNALADSQQSPLLPSSKCVPSAETNLSLTQMELQISSSDNCENNPVLGDPKQNHPKRLQRERPPKSKPAADNQGDSSLPVRGAIVNAQKLNVKIMKKQWPSRPRGQGIGRGRLSKQSRILKNKHISANVNVDNDRLQHDNQGNPKRNSSENPISGDPVQNPLKRPRGRPPKSKTVANLQGEPFFSSDDDIPSELKSNINKMENQLQYGQGRGRGRGRGVRGRGAGRGRGRRPICQDADHYEKQLQNEDQAMQQGTGSGRGASGSHGRGRGRPRKLVRRRADPSEEQCPQDQAEGLEQKQLELQSEAKQSQQHQGQGGDQIQDAGQEKLPNQELDAI